MQDMCKRVFEVLSDRKVKCDRPCFDELLPSVMGVNGRFNVCDAVDTPLLSELEAEVEKIKSGQSRRRVCVLAEARQNLNT